MTHLIGKFALPALLCSALFAQGDSLRFVPADSLAVLRVAAPAKQHSQFANTRIAKLLQARTLAPLLSQAEARIKENWQTARSKGQFDADLLEKLWSDYDGEITVALQMDPSALSAAIANQETLPMSLVIALSPSSKFDLATLASSVSELVERENGNKLRDLQVGDTLLRVVAGNEQGSGTVPQMIDGHLVMLLGTNLEAQAAHLLADHDRFPRKGDTCLSLDADLGEAISSLLDVVTEQADAGGAPFDMGALLAATGLQAIDSMHVELGTEADHVAAAFEMSFSDQPTGLLRAWLMEQAEPKLLQWLPAGSEEFSCAAINFGAIYQTIKDLWTEFDGIVPLSVDDFEAMVTEELKIRLKEDLIDSLGTEIMILGGDSAANQLDELDDENPLSGLGNICLGIALKDGKTFGASLEKALRARGLHAGRKTEEYANEKLHRLVVAAVLELEYCVLDDLLLVAIGKGDHAREQLRLVIDQRAAGGGDNLPAQVKSIVNNLDKGWSSISVTPISNALQKVSNAMEQLANLSEDGPELEQGLTLLNGVIADLRQLKIDTLVQCSYTHTRHLVTRLRW